MTKRAGVLMMILSGLMLLFGIAYAQEDPNVTISWPPPVYVLRGQVEIRGTANAADMTSYFLEFRPLNDDATELDEDAPWFPATLPKAQRVVDAALGVWDTSTTEDGLYQLRLTVNIARTRAVFDVVSPLRIENEPPDFVVIATLVPQINRATPTLAIITRPTLGATPTPFDSRPRVVANIDANVRRGDNVSYERVASLLAGESAELIGVSSGSSGWYYIELNNGRRGFIAPSLVTITGNTNNLPRFDPPATPTPTLTPTPVGNGDLLINGSGTTPLEPRCNQPLEIQANLTNFGARTTLSGGIVRMQNVDVDTNTVNAVFTDDFPVMTPGQNFVVVFPFTVTAKGEQRVTFTVDANNQVIEENELNNEYTFTYRLRPGTCP